MTLIKIPPMELGLATVCWSLRRKGKRYEGGWVPFEELGLGAVRSVQEIYSLDINCIGLLGQDHVDMIIHEATKAYQVVSLTTNPTELEAARRELGL